MRDGELGFAFSDGVDCSFSVHEVLAYRNRWVRIDVVDRVSLPLVVGLMALELRYQMEPWLTLQALYDLEDGTNRGGTKRPTPFRSTGKLSGLWHKHYLSPRFMPANILAELGKDGLERIVLDVMGEPDGIKTIKEHHIKEIAQRATTDPLDKSFRQQRGTGEWIVYLPYEGRNYYLSCETHKTGDKQILRNVMLSQETDFPRLTDWLIRVRQRT